MQLLIDQIQINPEYEGLVPRVTVDEYQTMKESIRVHGIREPIVINPKKIIIDGHTRFQIAKELALKEVPYREEQYASELDEQEAVIKYNVERRQLNDMQKGFLAKKIEDMEHIFAEKRKLLQLKQNKAISEITTNIQNKTEVTTLTPRVKIENITTDWTSTTLVKSKTPVSILSHEPISQKNIEEINKSVENGKARDKAAKIVGISSGQLYKTDKIIKAADKNPQIKKEMEEALAGKKSVNKVFNSVKQLEKREDKKVQLQTRELPTDQFEVIYADPPWEYEFSETEKRSLDNQYPQMKLEDICKLPINTTDDAILFLWTTSPKLEEGLKVLKSWGFTYKTNMVWIKDKIGMGYYARQRHELLLIGTKGKIGVPDPKDRPDSVIESPREEHSKKPDLYQLIEQMYPYRKYLELFARQKDRKNWTFWGNEI